MAWIEAHQELANHPKTKKLASKLSLSKPETIGSLMLLWWWAIDYATDGNLSTFEADIIADVMCYRGRNPEKLVTALIESGFLNDNMTIHDWDEYGGKLITAREESRERAKIRKQNQRERYKNNNVTRDIPVTNAGQPCDISVTDEGQTPCHAQNSKRTEQNRTEQKIIEEKNIKDITPNGEPAPQIDYQNILDTYNTICVSYPRITKLSEARRKAIKARLNQYKEEDFTTLFEKAESSVFLKGGNNRNWTATFDWMITDSNFAKVIDGNYDSSNGNGQPHKNAQQYNSNPWLAMIAEEEEKMRREGESTK